jgi:hypothetical protein
LLSISTRPAGGKMLQRFLKPVIASICQPRSNGHGPGEARICGSSSKRPFRPRLPDDSDRTSSPRQWNGGLTSVSIRTTDCFRIKTRCRREGSGTSLPCRSRGLLANRATPSSWMARVFRGPTSGRLSRAFTR